MTPLIRQLLLPIALVLLLSRLHSEPLPQDRGAAGVWQKLLKLRTAASLMLTIGQPDEEHDGMLALLGRGQGVRTALLAMPAGSPINCRPVSIRTTTSDGARRIPSYRRFSCGHERSGSLIRNPGR